MGKEITAFQVKRFRSLIDLKVEFNKELPTIICGEKNIGKTNFLRALNVFFNHFYEYEEIYDPKYDIPHHIYEGSRGGRANTELTGFFKDGNVAVTLKITLRIDGNIEYKKNGNYILDL